MNKLRALGITILFLTAISLSFLTFLVFSFVGFFKSYSLIFFGLSIAFLIMAFAVTQLGLREKEKWIKSKQDN